MAAGVYIHVPFCKSRCSYCDFATDIYRDRDTVEQYVESVTREIGSSEYGGKEIDTVYFGGGTPSLLTPKQVRSILSAVRDRFELVPGAEITLEMNPGTVSAENLENLKETGINRASFGVQTFDDQMLSMLARGHTSDDSRMTFKLLREAGFHNVSFDLIAGLPNQTLEDWSENLFEAVSLDPEHLSIYILEIHEGTPLAEQIDSQRRPAPDEYLAAEMYRMIQDRLDAAGYRQYEISNFSKPGFESRHNNKYWRMDAVYGFGVSAHSFDGERRRWSNVRKTDSYLSAVEDGKSALATDELLDTRQLAAEFGFLSLRLRDGLNAADFGARFGTEVFAGFQLDLEKLVRDGLLGRDSDSYFLTKRGMVFSNEVFEVFV